MDAVGAAGGSSYEAGGLGDGFSALLSGLSSGQPLYVCVNTGGGAGWGAGGGASGIALGTDFSTPLLVAGGGGAAGRSVGGDGGNSGIPIASSGTDGEAGNNGVAFGGGGGNNTAGHGGAAGGTQWPCAGGAIGTAGLAFGPSGPGAGGSGAPVGTCDFSGYSGGGGGAGYYGGGGGGAGGYGAGGGGGTSFCGGVIVSACTRSAGAGTQTTTGTGPGQAHVTFRYSIATSVSVRFASSNAPISGPVMAGTELRGAATMSASGAVVPTGSVTYTVTSGPSCDGLLEYEAPASLDGNGSAPSSAPFAPGSGDYSLLATYSGDQNYGPSESACVPFTVSPAANLSVTKSNGVSSVNPLSQVTYFATITNNGPSAADGTTLSDPAVAGLSKLIIGMCTAAAGAVCPQFGNGPGQLSIPNLEAGTVVVPALPVGGSIEIGITTNVTVSIGNVSNSFTATPASGVFGQAVTATDTDPVRDTLPPVVTLDGPGNGESYTLSSVPPAVCTTTDAAPGSGVRTPATLVYSGANVNGAGVITATCRNASDRAGNSTPPVSVTYTVTCNPTEYYSGLVKVKVNQQLTYQPQVTATVSLDPATCAVTGVALASATDAQGAIRLDTATNWKAPTQPAAGQWKFAMKTPNAGSGGLFLNNAYRAMDSSTTVLVKFTNNRLQLYLLMSGKAPTGAGSTKAGFEAQVTNLMRLDN